MTADSTRRAAVQARNAYRDIVPAFVERLLEKESRARPGDKAAIKATRTKLHQVAGGFFARRPDYAAALAELRACRAAGDDTALRACCRRLMASHASTRERLPFLADLYAAIFARVGPPKRVLDLGCGLNPLAIPWMALPAGCAYEAVDVYADLAAFLGAAFPCFGVAGVAAARDALATSFIADADLVLLLKCLPSFEQTDPAAVGKLLDTIGARHLVISYPLRSLGGRARGMGAHYEAQFWRYAAPRRWSVERLAFPNELVFLVTTEMARQ